MTAVTHVYKTGKERPEIDTCTLLEGEDISRGAN